MRAPFSATVVVERVLSQLDNGCIFSARCEDGSALRVKFSGKDTRPLTGDVLVVEGLLGEYRDRFGKSVRQLESKRMQPAASHGALLGPWLAKLPNIGPTRAERLLHTFGNDLAAVLCDVDRMNDVAAVIEPGKPALAARITAQIYAQMASQSSAQRSRAAEVEFLAFLEKLGIRETRLAHQLWRLMSGESAIDRLKRNPYVPASLIDWKTADRVGLRLLRQADADGELGRHPTRLMGAMNSVWRELLANGDTAATEEKVMSLLESRGVNPTEALRVIESNLALKRGQDLLRAPGAAWLEDQVTVALSATEARAPSLSVPAGTDLERLVDAAQTDAQLQLTDEQHAAIAKLLGLPVAVLQGGAGVGKTTVMKVLTIAWESLGGDVVMGALAGKAALALSRGASSHSRPRLAYTIARLISMLEQQRDSAKRTRQPEVSFTSRTLLVIDEAGMMDTPSLYKLLSLLPPGARVLLSGDEGQLPPVGIGKVFHDLVAEGSRVANLTKVLRQADDSVIPEVASQIRVGKQPTLQPWRGESKGVYLVSPSQLWTVQRQLRDKRELMVVAARRKTVDDINFTESARRRTADTVTQRLGPLVEVAVGDPIVATANRYAEGLFNGLLGTVTAVEGTDVSLLWDGETLPRNLSEEARSSIELAYAITCHKAQGSSSEAVIVVVEDSVLVTREWLYTAITRGRELVLLVGEAADIQCSVDRRTIRTTGFQVPARLRS
ncbi:ATP-dependent exoDNAse (exonuclease V), alpha subunit/helicase superfamily I member [Burkholderia sp. Ch1-1]|nr:ATP-dependent exoDNAse (exonuclease V), alpha subunit/helicase superfamily I member [Burkholderia sp. Ch1-1]